MHTCEEELVLILHAREKVAPALHRCDEYLIKYSHVRIFLITKYRNWPYVELTFDNFK